MRPNLLSGFLVGLDGPQLRRPGWPAMVAFHRLPRRPYATPRRWALDSGAFMHLLANGGWATSAETYAATVAAWYEAGGLSWAATQDWLCVPPVLAATGLTVAEHQKRTVESWHELRALAPQVPWVPTVQGWHPEEYLAHLDLYGPELLTEPVVGVGSIAARQGSDSALLIVHELVAAGLSLHGWGVKTSGLVRYGPLLYSADSSSWSHEARREPRLACSPARTHADCRNCVAYAELWARDRQAEMHTGRPVDPHQMSLLI